MFGVVFLLVSPVWVPVRSGEIETSLKVWKPVCEIWEFISSFSIKKITCQDVLSHHFVSTIFVGVLDLYNFMHFEYICELKFSEVVGPIAFVFSRMIGHDM
jgi:hypothetical protein